MHDNITLPPQLSARVEQAVDNFMQGYGCCQSVVAAFADLYGLDDTMAKRIAAGFGGGVGRMRMMCGAVSALVIPVGLDCGQTAGSDRATPTTAAQAGIQQQLTCTTWGAIASSSVLTSRVHAQCHGL